MLSALLGRSAARSPALRSSPHAITIPRASTFAMAPPSRRVNSSLPAGYAEDKSKAPMLRFQESLPRLPVPTLEETAARYYQTLKPLLPPEELATSKAAIQDFIAPDGPGHKLQARLIARREDPSVKNWLSEWWNHLAYLGYRDPVVPYVSYFFSYRDDRYRRDPARRAAAITTAALEFKKMVDEGTLEPEYMKQLPMCMDSYKWMFNASRVAAAPTDYPVKFDPATHKHVVVVRKNQFFKVPHELDGRALTPAELEHQFRLVAELADAAIAAGRASAAVGTLTAANRDDWAAARTALLAADPGNAASLEAIESASFLVCLDSVTPVTREERAHQYWHGDGANRWYDKPCQFVVADNGAAGFMGEHSMMDGTPTHRLNHFINDVIVRGKIPSIAHPPTDAPRANLPDPAPLSFVTSPPVDAAIAQSAQNFASTIGQHELAIQYYQGYGKNLIKRFKLSPDAYVQMIIQLAYYKMHGRSRPTYESAATRRFQFGRTETCRSVSDASVAFCRAMVDDDAAHDDIHRVTLFHDAVKSHLEYITAAGLGKGVDRHLLGLKMSLAPGEPLPGLFRDPAYAYSASWYLSTSQLSSEYFNGYGWSQVIDGGFGVAYMVNEHGLNFNVVSKRLGSAKLAFYLGEAANEIRDLLLPTLEPAKAKL